VGEQSIGDEESCRSEEAIQCGGQVAGSAAARRSPQHVQLDVGTGAAVCLLGTQVVGEGAQGSARRSSR
jgi:hypothetical protein